MLTNAASNYALASHECWDEVSDGACPGAARKAKPGIPVHVCTGLRTTPGQASLLSHSAAGTHAMPSAAWRDLISMLPINPHFATRGYP